MSKCERIDFGKLIAAARDAADNAYCPYSNYRVGAALLTEDGDIQTGCNVENGSYGLTVCAERVAVLAAVAKGKKKFKALALAAGNIEKPATPCGACRQVLAEFCAPDMPVVCAPLVGGVAVFTTMGELLPRAFEL